MDVRVLGPVELWHEGALVVLARRQQRLILGLLALEANRLVSGDWLVEVLWGEVPPARARAVLQSRVSELRAVLERLGGARLVGQGSGYVLRIDPGCVDVERFRAAVAGWRAAGSVDTSRRVLREALGLWRGPVLGGGVGEAAHSAVGYELESARVTAMEDLFDLELSH